MVPRHRFDSQMNRPSFLARQTCGVSNYFLIAICMAFLVALIPRATRRAIESNNNNAADWLPPAYQESADLTWFQRHFIGEQFALVTYDGCSLQNDEKLELLARKLVPGGPSPVTSDEDLPEQAPSETAAADGNQAASAAHHHWFKRVMTGRSMLEELASPPTSLSPSVAYRRLEGALIGPRARNEAGELQDQETRTSCMVVTLSKEASSSNQNMCAAIQAIEQVAVEECSIPRESLHMGGPPVDNVAIDVEGERTLMRLAVLSGVVGIGLSYWCFRSVKLTAMVFTIGVTSAAMSLALVFYWSVYEVVGLGLDKPKLGTVDAILMSMPSVVYVLGLSGAIHIVNYYKDARHETGLEGAAEAAFSHGWKPCALAAMTTAVGLGSLHTSDIVPIKKFGTFTALAVLVTLVILFTILPVALHRFPLNKRELEVGAKRAVKPGRGLGIADLLEVVGGFIVRRNVAVCVFWLAVMVAFAAGIPRIQTSVQLLKLFDEDADIIHDYAWLEEHLGNLVPMEVVLTFDPEQLRGIEPNDDAEANGRVFRLSPADRVRIIRRLHDRIESLPEVGAAMSVATFVPEFSDRLSYSTEYPLNRRIEASREALEDYLQQERVMVDGMLSKDYTGRELWRISARVRALQDAQGEDMDYGKFVSELKSVIDPVLLAYHQRDQILAELNAQHKTLAGSVLFLFYRAPSDPKAGIPDSSQEALLREVLLETQVRPSQILPINLARIGKDPELDRKRQAVMAELADRGAAVIASAGEQDAAARQLTEGIVPLIDVSHLQIPDGSAAEWKVAAGDPKPTAAVYTGIVPLVYKTQGELLKSLQRSIAWAAALISVVMIFVLRSPAAGLVSMIPNVFPIVTVFGALGWLGIKVDIGIMMTASVALGVAVDDTIHFVWWFRHGIREGMTRQAATMHAYDRCGTAMIQTTLIAGLGLAVFATSTFTPTQQFGYLMITMLSTALIGDLLLLPAILSGPVGKFFSGRLAVTQDGDSGTDGGGETVPSTSIFHAGERRKDEAHRRSARAS